MKSVVCAGLGRRIVADLPTPEPATGEALPRVAARGICHTDIDVLHRRHVHVELTGAATRPSPRFDRTVDSRIDPTVGGQVVACPAVPVELDRRGDGRSSEARK